MKITRTISSTDPSKCHMIAKNIFGITVGEVKHFNNGVRDWYAVTRRGSEDYSEATDFYHACDILLNDLGIIKTTCA